MRSACGGSALSFSSRVPWRRPKLLRARLEKESADADHGVDSATRLWYGKRVTGNQGIGTMPSSLRHDVDLGIEQLENGEYTEYDDRSLQERFERIKSEGRERLAERETER